MNRQNEITTAKPLLDSQGRITEEGWARHPYWEYRRGEVSAPWWRIKEWDYYYVLSDDLKRGITFTISDLGYAALMALCWLDFESGESFQADTIAPLTRGRYFSGSGLRPPDSDAGALSFENEALLLDFEWADGHRRLAFRAPDLSLGNSGSGVEGELIVIDPPGSESLNIATSWAENRKRFYYNRKMVCMPVTGTVRAGGAAYDFAPDSAFAGLDWGRGAWTYRNRWFWSSAGGLVDGRTFGFNLGYGFSDRSPASENILFADGIGHKLGRVRFDFDGADYTAPWRIADEEGRLEMDFFPIVDRSSAVNLGIIKSVQHQVFGRFSGTAVLGDGDTVRLDDFLGFAEDVYNRW